MESIRPFKVMRSLVLTLAIAAIAVIASLTFVLRSGEAAVPKLTNDEVDAIVDAAIVQADLEGSLFRVSLAGTTPLTGTTPSTGTTTRMHIAVVDRNGKLRTIHSMSDAWVGSVDIAIAKAYTAVAFSSNENALTSGQIGLLSQPDGPLWQIGNSNRPDTGDKKVVEHGIIEFPGGLPLYNSDGELVGAIGVSGDGVVQDENVAAAGSCGFEAPVDLRSPLFDTYLTADEFPCPPPHP